MVRRGLVKKKMEACSVQPRNSLEYSYRDGHTVRKYNVKTSQIPVLNFDDPKASELISAQVRNVQQILQ